MAEKVIDRFKFGIIGAGVVGTSLAVLLNKAGYDCMGVNTRSRESYRRFCSYLAAEHFELGQLAALSDILFITTNDAAIEAVASQLALLKNIRPGQVWVHCSGSLPSSVMCKDPAPAAGYLSVHPLQAFASIDNALELMPGTHFGIEGDSGETEKLGEILVKVLGGIPHKIEPAKKSAYHAGAVVASNYLVSLVAMAVILFEQAGIPEKDALKSLLPLVAGSYHNIKKVGLPYALTGPIARGDVEVVRKHLQEMPEELQEVYKGLGRIAFDLGKQRKMLTGGHYSKDVLTELQELLYTEKSQGDEFNENN